MFSLKDQYLILAISILLMRVKGVQRDCQRLQAFGSVQMEDIRGYTGLIFCSRKALVFNLQLLSDTALRYVKHLPHSSASLIPASQQFPVRVGSPPLGSLDALWLLLSKYFMVYLLQLLFHNVFITIAFETLLLACKLLFSYPHFCNPAPDTQCPALILVIYPKYILDLHG